MRFCRWIEGRTVTTGSVSIAVILLAGGCATAGRGEPAPRRIDLAVFAASGQPAPLLGAGGSGSSGAPAPRTAPVASAHADAAEGHPPPPAPMHAGARVIVDSMVGQVNGRPVFADEFFRPIADELIALGQRSTERQFLQEAFEVIRRELEIVVDNALFLAEAEASLTVQEKQGVRYLLQNLQETVTAEHRGSEHAARSEILQEQQQTLEEYVEELKDEQLILKLLREKIGPRIVITWHDVEQAYRQLYDQINPPGTATLARIRLATDTQQEQIDQVTQRLAEGERFLDVARSLNQPGGGVWQTFQLGEGGLAAIEFQNETVQGQVATLHKQGDTTEPFEVGSSTWWLHLAELLQQPHRDLYDPIVQRQLLNYLRMVRSAEERSRYRDSLLQRGIYDEIDEMAHRLRAIALLRYGPT